MPKADEYRRLAKACLATARAVANKERRHALIQMAQVWLRLADEQSQPVAQQQQQQQPQPADQDDKEKRGK
jgi:hypothetical protein